MPSPRSKNLAPQGRKRKRADANRNPKAPHRPSAYNQKLHDEIAYFCALCEETAQKLAEKCGISKQAMYDWFKKHPTFLDSWNKGKEEIKNASHFALLKRIKGMVIVDDEERIAPDGSIAKVIRKRELPPDVAAIQIGLNKSEKQVDIDNTIPALFLAALREIDIDTFNKVSDQVREQQRQGERS